MHFDVHEMAENEEAELEREIKFTTYFFADCCMKGGASLDRDIIKDVRGFQRVNMHL